MLNLQTLAASMLLMTPLVACAQSANWKERGAEVQATIAGPTQNTRALRSDGRQAAGRTPSAKDRVILPSGQEAQLLPNVFVVTTDADGLRQWVESAGLSLEPMSLVEGAFMVKVDVARSVQTAQAISKLDGVSTAAPNYRQKRVTK